MQEIHNWRELLGNFINDPQEKQRIAKELGVRPITLTRWVTNESEPRPQNLRRLLSALSPKQREQLLTLGDDAFEDFSAATADDLPFEIPHETYKQAFDLNATTTDTQRLWSIGKLILKSAIQQLDVDHSGMAIRIVLCMTPDKEGKIRSLREGIGTGTSPWPGDLEHQAMFLGAESLTGYAVTSCRPAIIQDINENRNLLPAQKVDFEVSSAAYPILFANRIAGCLLASSKQANHFTPQSRLTLMEQYANLIAIALKPEYFYPPDMIALRIMPSHERQKAYFTNYRKRVSDTIWDAMRQGTPISNIKAEELVWQQLEAELLQLAITEI